LIIALIEKPNIIYSNTSLNCTGMLISILTNRPHIWHIHEIYTDEYYSSYLSINTITNLILRHSEKIIAVLNKNISSNKIITIHNCLNEKELEENFNPMPQDVCSKNDWPISLIGYITPIKKQDLAIQAIKELVPKIPNIKLLLIGASTSINKYQNKLNYLVKSLSLENNIVFTGRRTDVMDILKNSKVLIIPSSSEGFSIVALEAMYCSTPIIASNSGGTIEVVRDKVNGRLFQPNNSHDFCKKNLIRTCPIKNYKELGISDKAKHFNSGVLVLNLNVWRKNNLYEKIIEYIKNDKYFQESLCHDQDALNAILSNNWKELDHRWNQIPHIYRFSSWDKSPFNNSIYHNIINSAFIIHYASHSKPWHFLNDHPLKREYTKYLKMTEWRDYKYKDITFNNAVRRVIKYLLPRRIVSLIKK